MAELRKQLFRHAYPRTTPRWVIGNAPYSILAEQRRMFTLPCPCSKSLLTVRSRPMSRSKPSCLFRPFQISARTGFLQQRPRVETYTQEMYSQGPPEGRYYRYSQYAQLVTGGVIVIFIGICCGHSYAENGQWIPGLGSSMIPGMGKQDYEVKVSTPCSLRLSLSETGRGSSDPGGC